MTGTMTIEQRSAAGWRGRTLRCERGEATSREAQVFGIAGRDPVLHVLRVLEVGGVPALVSRATYPGWLAAAIEPLPHDVSSIMASLEEGLELIVEHSVQRVGAAAASGEDARLLGVRRSSPVLRVVRSVRDQRGTAVELADDRYRPEHAPERLVSA